MSARIRDVMTRKKKTGKYSVSMKCIKDFFMNV